MRKSTTAGKHNKVRGSKATKPAAKSSDRTKRRARSSKKTIRAVPRIAKKRKSRSKSKHRSKHMVKDTSKDVEKDASKEWTPAAQTNTQTAAQKAGTGQTAAGGKDAQTQNQAQQQASQTGNQAQAQSQMVDAPPPQVMSVMPRDSGTNPMGNKDKHGKPLDTAKKDNVDPNDQPKPDQIKAPEIDDENHIKFEELAGDPVSIKATCIVQVARGSESGDCGWKTIQKSKDAKDPSKAKEKAKQMVLDHQAKQHDVEPF